MSALAVNAAELWGAPSARLPDLLDGGDVFWLDVVIAHVACHHARASDPILAYRLARIFLRRVAQANPVARCDKSRSQTPSQLDVLIFLGKSP
jgi:hypothetical protein